MTDFVGPRGPIQEVRSGMAVLDADGQEVGTVDDVRMADAGTATADGQGADASGGVFDWLAGAFNGAGDIDPQAQQRLARNGYVRVDATGVFSGHRYVEADQIAGVSGDEVRLSVSRDRLLG